MTQNANTTETNQSTLKPSIDKLPLIQFEQHQANFLSHLENNGRSVNTVKNYRTDLTCFKQFLENSSTNTFLEHIDLSQILEYGKFLQVKYTSDNSRRRRVQTLRIFFDYLVSEKIFTANPVRKIPTSPKFVDIPRPASFVDIKTLWTFLLQEQNQEGQINQLLAQRNQLILLLIFGGGLKVSDLSRLKKQHIYLSSPPRVLIAGDVRDPYSIELPEVFGTIFNNYLENLRNTLKNSTLSFDNLLFNANPYQILSGGLSPRGLEMIFEEFRKKLMINITPKSLRQACIFKWLHQKRPKSLIKEWLGVAPSYNLRPYLENLSQHIYSDHFLGELYYYHTNKH